MPLKKCIRTHTNREYETWMAWLDMQWNNPDLICHYLMQVAMEVRRLFRKNPNAVHLKHMKIPFESREVAVSSPASREHEQKATVDRRAHLTAISKSMWLSRMTIPPKKTP